MLIFYKPSLRFIPGHAIRAFLFSSWRVFQTVFIFCVALARIAILGVDKLDVLYSQRVTSYVYHIRYLPIGLFYFIFIRCSPTPWVFSFAGFSSVSNIDTFGVGALFAYLLLEVPVACFFARVILVVSRAWCLKISPNTIPLLLVGNVPIVDSSMTCASLGAPELSHRVANV